MSNWKKIRLGEVSKGGRGYYGIGASAVPYSLEKYTYLRITDINDDGTLNKTDLKSVDDAEAKNYLLSPNDVVFARTGNSTGRNYFYDGRDGELIFAGFLIKFSLDETKINPKYVKYFLQSQEYKDWVQSFNTGSTRGNINAQTYANLEIPLLPPKQQDLIAKVLGALDDKIECNNRINRNLEEQAAALFRRWFVDADKKTWHEVDLGSVVQTTSGGTPSRSNDEYYKIGTIHWVKSKELNSSFIINTEEKITEDAVAKSSAKKLPVNSILIAMYGATVGEYGIISKEMTCNQAICALMPNDKYPYTFLLNYVMYHKENMINLAVGSAQQNISQQLIKSLQIVDCTDRIKEFHIILEPLYQQIKTNIEENQTLATLRDTLLPKLMNNEIKV